MADSLNRIVPPSVSVDRGAEIRRERAKDPGRGGSKKNPGAESEPEHPSEPPGAEPAETDKDKGTRLDISA